MKNRTDPIVKINSTWISSEFKESVSWVGPTGKDTCFQPVTENTLWWMIQRPKNHWIKWRSLPILNPRFWQPSEYILEKILQRNWDFSLGKEIRVLNYTPHFKPLPIAKGLKTIFCNSLLQTLNLKILYTQTPTAFSWCKEAFE